MTPEFITFTGVDKHTKIEDCLNLSDSYNVEFGFLYSEDRTDNRYTGIPLIAEFYRHELNVAIHICGKAARDVIKYKKLPNICKYAHAVQINLRSEEYDDNILSELSEHCFIIKQTRNTNEWEYTPLGVYPLLDCSGGSGAEIQSWPEFPPKKQVGYAGGLKPGNVRPFLEKLPKHSFNFWIDMETGVRTNDLFDVSKCRQVCQEVYGS